ncbi:MAG TPA: hypothetical protein VGL23_23265 [Chloroflexota bacterium]
MAQRITRVEDVVMRVVGGDAPASWMISTRSPAQEQVDHLQNKLACVISNAEMMLEMVDGAARERLEAILRSAWNASGLAASLPLSVDTPAPRLN